MKMLVFGSVNIDHTYQLPHLVRAGETLPSHTYARNEGGKGFNQACALLKAGEKVHFAGAIGEDGLFLKQRLEQLGADVNNLAVLPVPTGHALIQVDAAGQNAIVLYGGANGQIPPEMVDRVLAGFDAGDYVLMQNEISSGAEIIRRAHARGLRVVLNPSPISTELLTFPLDKVEWLLLNEVEGEDLTGEKQPERMLDALTNRYPGMHIVLTLGEKGAVCASDGERVYQAAFPVKAVDTTAAGDTFTGYFLSSLLRGDNVQYALKRAARASAIAVSRPGASVSVPFAGEVDALL